MKLKANEFAKLFEDSDYSEFTLDKQKVEERIKHFHAQEKREDHKMYSTQDPKRKIKNK